MKDIKNDNVRKIAKKGLTVGLCAVLTGGVIFGTVDGVSRLTGWKQTENVSAAAADRVELLKTEAEKSGDGSEGEEEASANVKGSLDVSDIVEEAMPFVVSITTKSLQEVQSYYGYYFGNSRGYAPQQQEVEGSGSGIIIGKNDDNLLIVTNNHVVEGANTVSVSFIDGSSYEAEIRGTDSDKDLAVVAVPLADIDEETMGEISVASIGSSDDLKVGEQVIAIGNAMGYGQSVTTGIVSAKNRRMDENTVISGENDSVDDEDGVNLIQTDAAINPGNSGGALLNMNGEVVGINSAKLASTTVEGMGYAIAISDVADVLEDLMNVVPRDKVEGKHGILGIMASNVSDEAVEMYGIPEGAFVSEVTEGGAAEAAGIKKNSVITKFDGKRVHNKEELVELLEYYEPGEEVEVTLQVMDSEGYQEKVVTVTLMEDTSEDESEEESSADNDETIPDEEMEDIPEEDAPVIEDDPDSIFDEWADGGEIPDIRDFFKQIQ